MLRTLNTTRECAKRLALSDFYTQSTRASSSAVDQSRIPVTSTTAHPDTTTHYRVTLRRSAIGLPKQTNKVLEALGLRRRLQSVYRPRRADIAGMLLAVKELVHVENVRRLDGDSSPAITDAAAGELEADLDDSEAGVRLRPLISDQKAVWVNEAGEVVDWGGRQARKAPRGFTVVGNISNELRHQQIQEERAVTRDDLSRP